LAIGHWSSAIRQRRSRRRCWQSPALILNTQLHVASKQREDGSTLNFNKTMNRIYQGKVTAVEIPDGKDEQGKPLDLDVLWQHHELFQDAVNY
jgi:hypothetical protein